MELGLNTGAATISFQVAQEFLNLSQRKLTPPMTLGEARIFLQEVLTPLCRVFPSMTLLGSAMEIKDRYKFHFYNSLIVAAALEAGCERLYSEDLQHGQQIARLRIGDSLRYLRPRSEITAPSGLAFCPPAAAQKGLHIPDMRPFTPCGRTNFRRRMTQLFQSEA